MTRPALRIEVTTKDRKELLKLLSGGVQQVRVVLRRRALSIGPRTQCAAHFLVIPLTPQAIRNVGHRYQQGGLERALYEKPRPGAAQVLNENQKQSIIAMVCSSPPEGRPLDGSTGGGRSHPTALGSTSFLSSSKKSTRRFA